MEKVQEPRNLVPRKDFKVAERTLRFDLISIIFQTPEGNITLISTISANLQMFSLSASQYSERIIKICCNFCKILQD